MALGFDESKKKYYKFIESAHSFKVNIENCGLKVEVSDDIELGATYKIYDGQEQLCEVAWNVPYYIYYDAMVNLAEESYDMDNVKNIDDWKRYLGDIEQSLKDYVSNKK